MSDVKSLTVELLSEIRGATERTERGLADLDTRLSARLDELDLIIQEVAAQQLLQNRLIKNLAGRMERRFGELEQRVGALESKRPRPRRPS